MKSFKKLLKLKPKAVKELIRIWKESATTQALYEYLELTQLQFKELRIKLDNNDLNKANTLSEIMGFIQQHWSEASDSLGQQCAFFLLFDLEKMDIEIPLESELTDYIESQLVWQKFSTSRFVSNFYEELTELQLK